MVGGSQGIVSRLGDRTVRLVPRAGPALQLCSLLWLSLFQSLVQQAGKEGVIAVPFLPLVERGEK
jgi:hypothetical protein